MDFGAAGNFIVRSPHLNPNTIIYKPRIGQYLHNLKQLYKSILGLEIPVIIRTNSGRIEKASRFSKFCRISLPIVEVTKENDTDPTIRPSLAISAVREKLVSSEVK